MKKKLNNNLKAYLSHNSNKFNRQTFLLLFMGVCFLVLIVKLYVLQIVNGDYYVRNLKNTTVKTLSVEAPRGEIFDRYGRPLAINESTFTIQMDPQISGTAEQINDAIYNVCVLFNENDEDYIDELPLSAAAPYEFLFNDSSTRELRWKKDMGFAEENYNMTADESFQYLLEKFGIIVRDKDTNKLTSKYDPELHREMLSFRSALYMQRYKKYTPVILCYDASPNTMSEIEEQPEIYRGISNDVTAVREYPTEKYTSLTLGYVRNISDEELTEYKKTDKTYTLNDKIGKTGIEKAFEQELRGKNGTQVVETNNVGKIMNVLSSVEPEKGDNVQLTIDSRLQKKSYDILENYLRQIQIDHLQYKSAKDKNISTNAFYKSFVQNSNLSLSYMKKAKSGTVSKKVYKQINEKYDSLMDEYDAFAEKVNGGDKLTTDELERFKVVEPYVDYDITTQIDFMKIFALEVEDENIAYSDIMKMCYEQGVISTEDKDYNAVMSNSISPSTFAIRKLSDGTFSPQMTGLDPSTGSVMVVDVKTGDVLVSTSYPSYDNNKFVNNFDNDYYYKQSYLDTTNPMLNRPFMEPRAPGSTFKMLSGITALEEGSVTANERIYDGVVFEKAGQPYLRNWSTTSFGYVDLADALEQSINYYFCEIIYRLGNAENGNAEKSIELLSKYSKLFGLGERSGVEIGEFADMQPEDLDLTSSPEYKKYMKLLWNANTPQREYQWYDGDTVASSIGQALSNYTTASMVKYVATIASNGKRMQLHLLNKVTDSKGTLIEQFTPVVETTLDEISQDSFDAVKYGMRRVITDGTGKSAFADFPIEVAGKTGTAQESKVRNDHSSFAGFAPYDDPEVAIYVMMPYGQSYSMGGPAARVASEVLAEYYNLGYEEEPRNDVNEVLN